MQSLTNQTRQRRAYTLLELIIVVAIMFVVMALASPMVFQAMYSDTRVTAAADQVRASWANCRYQAMDTGTPYQFSVVPNSGKYKIEPYDGTDQQASLFMPDMSANADHPGPVFEDILPEGIRFGTKERPVDPESEESMDNNYVRIAVFWPDGTAQDDVEVNFGGKGGGSMTIRLNAATGAAILMNNPDLKEPGK